MFLSTLNASILPAFLLINNFKIVNIINPPIPIELVAIENCDVNTASPRKI